MATKNRFMNLRDRVVLVTLVTKIPAGKKQMKEAVDAINDKYGARDAGIFSKNVFSNKFLAKIRKVKNDFYKRMRDVTLSYEKPWRMLPIEEKAELDIAYAAAKNEWDIALDEVEATYAIELKERELDLGELFDPSDYPKKEEIRSMFVFEMPPPKAIENTDDLRVLLSDEELEMVEKNFVRMYNKSLSGVWDRIEENVSRLSDSIEKYEVVVDPVTGKEKTLHGYHQTAVDNLRNLVKVLPSLNIDNNPKLEEIADRIETELTRYDVSELKDNDRISKNVKDSADKILEETKDILDGYAG